MAGRGSDRDGLVEGMVCWARRVATVLRREDISAGRVESWAVWRETLS